MAYIEDLVQNIYTNCDMSGLDKLNRGLANANMYTIQLDHNLRQLHNAQKTNFDFSAKASNFQKGFYIQERNKQKLLEYETKMRMRLNDYEERYAQRKARRDDAELRRMRQRNWLWRSAIRLVGVYFSVQTLKNIFDTGSRLQLVQKSIEGLTKSTQDWQYIQQQAFKTGTDIDVVAKGYRNFFSSARMAGFGTGDIQGMYGDVLLSTRAIGASTTQTEGALLALEQMLSKGTVSMEELRRQLGNAIPGAFEIGAKAMDMTTVEFNKFVKTGQLASAVFVPRFIAQLKKEYSSGFKEISQTVDFASKNLVNSWKMLTLEIVSGDTGKSLAKGINALSDLLRSNEFKQIVDFIGKITGLVITIFTLAIKYLPIILTYLGARGLTSLLPKIATWLTVIGVEMQTIFSYGVINGIRYLTKALWGMLAPLIAISAEALALVAIILILQDLWTTLRHPSYKTVTKKLLRSGGHKFAPTNPFRPDEKNIDLKDVPAVISNPKTSFAMPGIPNIIPNNSIGDGGLYQKDETIANNVTIGDIQIISNSNNPQQVAQEVQNQLVALFMGQGLMTNVGETVVG